jgi:hypothetical protein
LGKGPVPLGQNVEHTGKNRRRPTVAIQQILPMTAQIYHRGDDVTQKTAPGRMRVSPQDLAFSTFVALSASNGLPAAYPSNIDPHPYAL